MIARRGTLQDSTEFILGLFDSAVDDGRLRHAGSVAYELVLAGWSWSALGSRVSRSGITVRSWWYAYIEFDKKSKPVISLEHVNHTKNAPHRNCLDCDWVSAHRVLPDQP